MPPGLLATDPAADDADAQPEGAGLLGRRSRRMGRLFRLGFEGRRDLPVLVDDDRALRIAAGAGAAPAFEPPARVGSRRQRDGEVPFVGLFTVAGAVDVETLIVAPYGPLALDLDGQLGIGQKTGTRGRGEQQHDGCSQNDGDDAGAHLIADTTALHGLWRTANATASFPGGILP